MVFSSPEFLLVFLPAVVIIYFLIGRISLRKTGIISGAGRTGRNIFLFLASIVFYAWGEPLNVFIMLFSILITWALGLAISRSRISRHDHSRLILTIGICYHVFLLFIFKYLTFAAQQIGLLIHRESTISVALPVGISFYTFQLMSYLFDVYYQTAGAQTNPLYVGLYTAFFPQLIAGPIVRYKDIAREIKERHESMRDVSLGMKRFIYGLAKKVLIANYVAKIADNVFDSFQSRSVLLAWLGTIAYTLQIYFDFSGYSDMAIGLGRIFGFHFKENFNYPYIAKNVTDFWRRWHISLSSWFRDYVYIPLGGNRVKKSRWIFNIFIVWLLTGIWHGANWTFLLWGMIYFLILIIEKLSGLDKKQHGKVGTVICTMITLIIVNAEWAIFRADSVTSAFTIIGNMVGIGANGFIDQAFLKTLSSVKVMLVIALFAATPLYQKFTEKLKEKGLGQIEQIWVFIIGLLALMETISSTYNPFIYFNF